MDLALVQREIDNEQLGLQWGIQEYRKRVQESTLDVTDAGIIIIKKSLPAMVKAVEALVAKDGVHYIGKKELQRMLLRVDEIAYLTIQHCLCFVDGKDSFQNVAITLTSKLLEQHEFRKFEQHKPAYVAKILRDLQASTLKHKRRVLSAMHTKQVRKGNIELTKDIYPKEVRLSIGVRLIDALIASTGLVMKVMEQGKLHIVGHPTTMQWITKHHAKFEVMRPYYLPMIIPPKDWTGAYDGGYLLNESCYQHCIIKTENDHAIDTLLQADLRATTTALNIIQQTRWKINTRMLKVIRAVWDEGGNIAGLPSSEMLPLPAKQWKDDEEFKWYKEHKPEVVVSWKRKAAVIHDYNARNKSKRLAAVMKMRIAEMFQNEEAIYFPHNMDWRGRIYPIPQNLHPQSDDLGKSLLVFADKKPLGISGVRWLKIHGANSYGVDKVSFNDRVKWVEENSEMILSCAANPLDDRRWTHADSPFMFLAFCYEYKDMIDSGNPETFESNLPINMDGSNNGLQHFAAILADPESARVVNLQPSEKPFDIYQTVADHVNREVNKDIAAGHEIAKLWEGRITRSIAKRPTMTYAYSATQYGFKEQLQDELRGQGIDLDGDGNFRPALYLAEKMNQSIKQVVSAAPLAMEWLQSVAKAFAACGLPVIWTTPLGFKAHQEYRKKKLKRCNTLFGGTRYQLGILVPTPKLDCVKQCQGIAPNFIHSLDSCHLQMTVLAARNKGIHHFSMIHDSFGCHAADIDLLNRILREQFVELYGRRDVLKEFYNELMKTAPPMVKKQLTPPPSQGSFDLSLVLESDYFFA